MVRSRAASQAPAVCHFDSLMAVDVRPSPIGDIAIGSSRDINGQAGSFTYCPRCQIYCQSPAVRRQYAGADANSKHSCRYGNKCQWRCRRWCFSGRVDLIRRKVSTIKRETVLVSIECIGRISELLPRISADEAPKPRRVHPSPREVQPGLLV